MRTREKWLLSFTVVVSMLLVGSIGAISWMGKSIDKAETRQQELRQKVSQIEGDLAVLEPFRDKQLQKDQEDFNVVMSDFEQKAAVGNYPAGQTFDEAVLPYVYKFYVASYLGYMDKKVSLSLVVRARNFIGGWKHTFAQSDRTVQAIYIELLDEIEKDKQKPDQPQDGGEKIQIKAASGSSVVFFM